MNIIDSTHLFSNSRLLNTDPQFLVVVNSFKTRNCERDVLQANTGVLEIHEYFIKYHLIVGMTCIHVIVDYRVLIMS